jgi:hypothetical protein
MPTLDLTEEEHVEVIQAIRVAMDGDRYVLPVTFFFEGIEETEAKAEKPKRPKTG